MKRRQFIKATIGGGVTMGLLGTAAAWHSGGSDQAPLTIDAALHKLKLLSDQPVSNLGQWQPDQIFAHCAQSVEFSMSGFPAHKSAIFKNTLGKLAFSIFSSKGEMSHGLSEVIPGAPALALDNDINTGLHRLEKSLAAFKQYEGDLSPHFAYGDLSKEDYEIAHVLHLYNHLQEIIYNK